MSYPPYLREAVRRSMAEHGFRTEFPPPALSEANAFSHQKPSGVRDLTSWLWSAIDNDETRDVDQLEVTFREADGIRVYVAIASVEDAVAKGSALDEAARHNTTSVYTSVETFPMLPERLSTGETSLLEGQTRGAWVIDMTISGAGEVTRSTIFPAVVRNKAQLAYNAVAHWFHRKGLGGEFAPPDPTPATPEFLSKIEANSELQAQLALQLEAAQALRSRRLAMGALTLQTTELRPTARPDGSIELRTHEPTPATRLIEDLMIATNQSADDFLSAQRFPILQRIVRTPKRWERIVQLAADRQTALPADPDPKALQEFLLAQRAKDPQRFPDLSLAVVKLLGRGEYVVVAPGEVPEGHFALAAQHYSHTTAPNRRYPDVVTQRLLDAATQGAPPPHTLEDLAAIALRCTTQEDEANKVERFAKKCVAALSLSRSIGQTYEGFITGASEKGTWVRLNAPPVEGRVERLTRAVDVGDRVVVKLILADPMRGYIDFELVKRL